MADLSSLLGAAGIGGAIGKAIVSLELETTKYQGELKAMQAETVASTNTSSGAFSKFGGIANAALLGVGAAAVAGLALSVKAAIEANDAHLKLQNTFENNARLSDSSVEAFEAQADALRDLTGVDDEAINGAQALLGQFKLTGDQVTQLIPLIVDLSAKMDIDLNTAAKAVGKATQGNTAALSRFGIMIDATALQTDAFGATLNGLGVAQGFAADRAKAEPWRLLGAAMEEVAEKVGQALIPAIQGIAGALITVLPLLEKLAQLMQFLPIAQMGEDADSSASRIVRFGDALIDTIPVLGHFIDLAGNEAGALGRSGEAAENHLSVIGELSQFYRDKFNTAIDSGTSHIVRFAHMTKAELDKWSDDTKESFDTFVESLEDITTQSGITAKDFAKAHREMLRDAEELSTALRRISKEKWINDEYIAFLSDQGPEWLIAFSDLTTKQQHVAQDAWEETTRKTDKAKDSLDRITGVLDKLDKGESKHTVIIEYRYEGFDPSKPGMSGSAQQR